MTASVTLTDAIIEALRSEPHVIVARQDLIEAKADATAAVAPFLPKAQLIIDEERFLPANGFSPVTVVGTNVLGGTRSYSAYGAITLSWSIVSSGRDVAGLHAARADVHASTEALHGQFADTLSALLKAYSDVYETQVSLAQQGQSLILLKAIAQRADERYQHGNGTTIAIGQARGAALDAEKSFNEACRSLTEKSSALAKAMGIRLPGGRIFEVVTKLPEAPAHPLEASDFDVAIGADPAVLAAREKVVAAEEKARQTRSAFGPQISLDARRDYLGQNIDSFSAANNSLASNSYRVDISLVQPIFPFLAEIGALDKAKAEVRRAEALAEDARNEVDSKLRTAVSADSEARSSYRAANSSLREAEQVLVLTESLYKAGRTDLDEIERAKIDLQKITAEVEMLASTKSRAAWDVERALSAARFPTTLMHQVGIELADEYLGYGR
jgi:outer membrane protein TolC